MRRIDKQRTTYRIMAAVGTILPLLVNNKYCCRSLNFGLREWMRLARDQHTMTTKRTRDMGWSESEEESDGALDLSVPMVPRVNFDWDSSKSGVIKLYIILLLFSYFSRKSLVFSLSPTDCPHHFEAGLRALFRFLVGDDRCRWHFCRRSTVVCASVILEHVLRFYT